MTDLIVLTETAKELQELMKIVPSHPPYQRFFLAIVGIVAGYPCLPPCFTDPISPSSRFTPHFLGRDDRVHHGKASLNSLSSSPSAVKFEIEGSVMNT